jgi:small-conductance mechanosensitive channel
MLPKECDLATAMSEGVVLILTSILRLLVLVLAVVWGPQPGQSQEGQAAPRSRPGAAAVSLTPAQAQQVLEVLQNDEKRAQLIQTLQALGQVAPPGTEQPSQPLPADNLGVQLLKQASDWLGEVSGQLALAARAVSDFPMVWRWLVQMATDPTARNTLLGTAWKLSLVIVCALAAEWLVQRAIFRPLAVVRRYVPIHARSQRNADGQNGKVRASAAQPDSARELRRRRRVLAYVWQLLQRLPFVLTRLVLDLLPVVGFAAVGNSLLATQLGSEATPRLVTLAIVNAYVLCRGIMCATRALVSPTTSQPSLLIIRDETAAYIDIWMRRLVIAAVFGVAFANVALLLGLYFPAYDAVVKLVVLVAHLFVVIVILQCRRNIADLIRAPEAAIGVLAMLRNRLADKWHYVAIVLNLALWVVWALRVKNGYALVLQYFLATVSVLVIARLISMAVSGALERLFRVSPDFIRQFPGLEARANRYFPALHNLVSGLIAAITAIALLEVWGIDVLAWFDSSRVGSRLLSALLTIVTAVAVAFVVWEVGNVAIERHLARLTREGHYGRRARLRTFLPMLRTTLLSVILTVVVLTALSELGVNIAPLLAGAGIIGIAIGFGSQKLVQDVITGLFLLLENAMQVGDIVTVSGLTGTVENLSIRTIRLRAGDGSVHIIPFSSVTSVTNTNRGIGNASISVNVAYKEDTDRVGDVLKEIAAQMRREPEFKPWIRGDLDLWGVDKVDASMATIVGQIECTDTGRWPVQREFYRRMKRRFQELGIEIARPSQTTVVLQQLPAEVPEPQPSARAAAGG